MPIRFFTDENRSQGLPAGAQATVQAGVNNTDSGKIIEQGLTLPWIVDPATSWLGYACMIEVRLDAGVALHRPLPQDDPPVDLAGHPEQIDTVASVYLSDAGIDAVKNAGVNTTSKASYADVVQQMATPHWMFILRGWGMRAGYQIPIPGLRTVASVPAIPAETQYGVNQLVGNYNGIPVFYAEWELWYYVALPPRAQQLPPPNMALHLSSDIALPAAIGVPVSQPDQNAVAQPVVNLQFVVQK